jgi:hypothetical protein
MPRQIRGPKRSLEEVKACQTEQLRIRAEARVAQLKQESYKLELSEVLAKGKIEQQTKANPLNLEERGIAGEEIERHT